MSALYRVTVLALEGAHAELSILPLQLDEIRSPRTFALLALLGAAVDPMPESLEGSLPRTLAVDPDGLFGRFWPDLLDAAPCCAAFCAALPEAIAKRRSGTGFA